MSIEATCGTNEVLIEGACLPICPTYFTDAAFLSPAACVSNVPCPDGYAEAGNFSICQKPVQERVSVSPDENGDCQTGYTFWDSMCLSVCPSGFTIFDGTTCKKDCPVGFLSSASNCFKPVLIRTPTTGICPLNQFSNTNGMCESSLPPFNAKFMWLSVALGLLLLVLIVFSTKDVSFSFSSKSTTKPNTIVDETMSSVDFDLINEPRFDVESHSTSESSFDLNNQVW